MTHDTEHVTQDMTLDKWGEVHLLSKIQLPNFFGLVVKVF